MYILLQLSGYIPCPRHRLPRYASHGFNQMIIWCILFGWNLTCHLHIQVWPSNWTTDRNKWWNPRQLLSKKIRPEIGEITLYISSYFPGDDSPLFCLFLPFQFVIRLISKLNLYFCLFVLRTGYCMLFLFHAEVFPCWLVQMKN